MAFLCHPRSYPDRPRTVRLIQTHASYVFMTSRHVYKVKKPVKLGFLDFSTLRKRRYFCDREVLLNRRLSSHVHLGVLPIFLKAGRRLAFDGGERVVEYVIQMRRLDDRYFLPRLLKRREAGRSELNRIVVQAQEVLRSATSFGRNHTMGSRRKAEDQHQRKLSADGTFRWQNTISRPAFEAIRHYTTKFYQRQRAPFFGSGCVEQRIRDGHGDLRLEHIHLTPKRLSIYDCIEFSDRPSLHRLGQ